MSDVTLPLIVGTITVVGVGTVVTDKTVNGKAILAGGVVALGLSAMDNVNTKMAEMFAAMVFLSACFKFVPPMVQSLGYAGGASGNQVTVTPASQVNAAPASNTGGSTATPPNSGGATKSV